MAEEEALKWDRESRTKEMGRMGMRKLTTVITCYCRDRWFAPATMTCSQIRKRMDNIRSNSGGTKWHQGRCPSVLSFSPTPSAPSKSEL